MPSKFNIWVAPFLQSTVTFPPVPEKKLVLNSVPEMIGELAIELNTPVLPEIVVPDRTETFNVPLTI
jgi:hypothetical protein